MLYTILFSIIGASVCYVIGKCTNMDFSSSRYGMSSGPLFVCTGFLLCMGIGFGYGSALLSLGTHPFNKLINYFK